jgi:hypothetical protein
MLTFKQFVTELAKEDVTISAAELREMADRFGDRVFQMGHVEEDGSMRVPVECVLEAASSLENRTLAEAAESINNQEMVSALKSGETLVERVIAARERRLRELIRDFQTEPDSIQSNRRWKRIEKEVFGVDFHD